MTEHKYCYHFTIHHSLFKMDRSQRIQAKTDNGDTIIDFLIEVMTDQLDHFKMNHRLQAARLLTKYGCSCKSALSQRDEGIAFILNNLPEPSLHTTDSTSSEDSSFDTKLAKVIRESTDDGATVCRFLINVMEGELKAFKPQHRISASRELLDRGFGKHATPRHSVEGTSPRTPIRGRNPEEVGQGGSHSSLLSTHSSTPSPQPTESEKSHNHTNQSSDSPEEQKRLAEIAKIVDDAIKESDRIIAEHPEQAPEYVSDLSVFDLAWENSQKRFEEWKNSIDPEEYRAIIRDGAARFDAKLERRIERRKQIAAEREQREKEEAERLAHQKEAEVQAAAEEPAEPGPPTRSQHKPKLMFTLGRSMYVDCGHPDCDLHDEDRGRWQGSVQYGAGPTTGHFP